MKINGSSTDRMYSFLPGCNPFVLGASQLRPKIPDQQMRAIRRWPNSAALEKQLADRLPEMPQLTMRGHSDESRRSDYAFLISATPVAELISKEETGSPLFFKKLYATTAVAFGKGLAHVQSVPNCEMLVISIHSRAGQLTIQRPEMFVSSGFSSFTYDGSEMETLPLAQLGRLEVGFIGFPKTAVLEGMAVPHQLAPADFMNRMFYRRTAIAYHAVLELMVALARQNWQPNC